MWSKGSMHPTKLHRIRSLLQKEQVGSRGKISRPLSARMQCLQELLLHFDSAQGHCSAEAIAAVSPVRQRPGAETALSTSLLPITSAMTRLSPPDLDYSVRPQMPLCDPRASSPESRTRARTRLNLLALNLSFLLHLLAVQLLFAVL